MTTLSLNPNASRNIWLPVFAILGALFLAVLAGLITSFLPWYFVIGLVLVPLVFGFSISYPAVGVLVAFALFFQVIPEYLQPRLPFGGGKLRIYDLLIIYLFMMMLLRSIKDRTPIIRNIGPFWVPLAYLLFCVLLSAAYVKAYAPNPLLLGEGRAYIVWSLIPLTALAVSSMRQVDVFRNVVICIAVIVASYVCVQTFTGIQIISGVDLSQSTSGAELNSGVIRSIAGGATYIIAFTLYLAVNRMLEKRWSIALALPLALLMLTAIGASFGRGVWAAGVFGLLVSAWVLRGVRGAFQVGALMLALLLLMLGLVFAGSPKTGSALIDRVSSYGNEFGGGRGTLTWRRIEIQQAVQSIERRPLMGVGIGGEYKLTVSSRGSFGAETVYIHNSYLHFPLKMGVHAALIPVLFIGAFFLSIRRALTIGPGTSDRGLIAAIAGSFMMMLLVSFTQPEWASPPGIAAYCILIGMLLQYLRFAAAPGVASPGRG